MTLKDAAVVVEVVVVVVVVYSRGRRCLIYILASGSAVVRQKGPLAVEQRGGAQLVRDLLPCERFLPPLEVRRCLDERDQLL